MNGGSCGSCSYFYSEKTTGCCRKAPPVVFILGVQPSPQGPQAIINSFWPPVSKAMWCGEYKVKGVHNAS